MLECRIFPLLFSVWEECKATCVDSFDMFLCWNLHLRNIFVLALPVFPWVFHDTNKIWRVTCSSCNFPCVVYMIISPRNSRRTKINSALSGKGGFQKNVRSYKVLCMTCCFHQFFFSSTGIGLCRNFWTTWTNHLPYSLVSLKPVKHPLRNQKNIT